MSQSAQYRNSPPLYAEGQGGTVKADAGLAITLSGVSKAYGPRPVLHATDLHIEPGTFIAIVGRSGTGKSTLLRLIAGLDEPDHGDITLGGVRPAANAHAIRMMFQDGRLLPWRRVIDNVALGLPRSAAQRARTALEAVGLADRASEWPRVLSGGQRQRVALARALAADPKLVLLDEPLGALDALTRLDMQALIETIWQRAGFTAVLVTHDVAEAVLLADRVLLMDNGGIAMDVSINLARPRRTGAEVAAYEAQILEQILEKK